MTRSKTSLGALAVVVLLMTLCGCTSGAGEDPPSSSSRTVTSIVESPSVGLEADAPQPYGRLPLVVPSSGATQRFGPTDTRAGVQQGYAFVRAAVNDQAALADGRRVIGDYAVVRPLVTASFWRDLVAEVGKADPQYKVWGVVPSVDGTTLTTDDKHETSLDRPELLDAMFYGFETRVDTAVAGKTRLVVQTKVDLSYRSATDRQTATLERNYVLALLKSGRRWLVDAVANTTSREP